MTRRSKIWLTIASIFTIINVAGAGFAIAVAEGLHAVTHVALTFVGAYFMRRILRGTPQVEASDASLAAERLDHLQHSVDAVAIEVERIGEAQRFATKLAAERVHHAAAAPPKRS